MTLAIKIGAGSQVYDNLALANSMRGNQKLSIVGTGEEIKAELTNSRLTDAIAANVGSIKATNDLNLTTTQVDQYKAALLKLGTKSIVLDSTTTAANIADKFNQLDAVYTKIKSITIFNSPTAPTIAVEKLATAVNLAGLEKLTGKMFNVSGTAATIKANMSSLLKNIAQINSITIASGSEVKFTAQQLSVLGDKLTKTDNTSKVILTDTADNLLTTGSLSLINKLNNTNLNAPSSVATVASQANSIITADKSFNTGDAVTYNGAVAGKDGVTYYARKLSDTTFSIFTTYAAAVDTSSNTGIVATTGMASTETFTSQVGNPPIRNTTLDSVEVTKASLAQTNRFAELTAVKSGIPNDPANPATVTRDLSNIISYVEIADTETNLNVAETSIAASGLATHATDAGRITTGSNHGYTTGDAVTYSVATGQTKIAELTSGSTYYVGKVDATKFVLFSTRAAALTADLTSLTTAAAGGAINFATSNTATAANQSFTTSALDKTMSAVGRFKDNTGSVGRVTIKGDSSRITAATLNDIAIKAKRGDSINAKVAYSAKGVDISNNLQALFDNITVTTASHLDEIVVTDGTATGKKGFSMSQTFYTALNSIFDAGVDNVSGNNTNKNYSFTVTGATFANIGTLQSDVNVGAFSVTGASYTNLTTATNLVDSVSKSKLKTITTLAITDTAQQAAIRSLVNSIGSPTDRAKVKLITA
jgi:hypothetical protein